MQYRRECFNCGSEFLAHAKGGRVYCEECNNYQVSENARKKTPARHNGRFHGKAYTIISDPDPLGGFSAGAVMDSTLHKLMLLMGSYTTGTVIADLKGDKYQVVYKNGHQRMVEINA
jgi:ribosomal protein S27AE